MCNKCGLPDQAEGCMSNNDKCIKTWLRCKKCGNESKHTKMSKDASDLIRGTP